jgi:hypothetical protein
MLSILKRLSQRARSQLINDVFSLSQAGYVDAKLPLNLIKYMSKEIDYLPWNTLINNRISFFIDMLESTEYYGDLKTFLARLVEPYYKKLGWNESDEKFEWVDRFIRNSVISFACRMDLPDCLAKSKAYFSEWMSDPNNNKYCNILH